jgi:hypothetical protein
VQWEWMFWKPPKGWEADFMPHFSVNLSKNPFYKVVAGCLMGLKFCQKKRNNQLKIKKLKKIPPNDFFV